MSSEQVTAKNGHSLNNVLQQCQNVSVKDGIKRIVVVRTTSIVKRRFNIEYDEPRATRTSVIIPEEVRPAVEDLKPLIEKKQEEDKEPSVTSQGNEIRSEESSRSELKPPQVLKTKTERSLEYLTNEQDRPEKKISEPKAASHVSEPKEVPVITEKETRVTEPKVIQVETEEPLKEEKEVAFQGSEIMSSEGAFKPKPLPSEVTKRQHDITRDYMVAENARLEDKKKEIISSYRTERLLVPKEVHDVLSIKSSRSSESSNGKSNGSSSSGSHYSSVISAPSASARSEKPVWAVPSKKIEKASEAPKALSENAGESKSICANSSNKKTAKSSSESSKPEAWSAKKNLKPVHGHRHRIPFTSLSTRTPTKVTQVPVQPTAGTFRTPGPALSVGQTANPKPKTTSVSQVATQSKMASIPPKIPSNLSKFLMTPSNVMRTASLSPKIVSLPPKTKSMPPKPSPNLSKSPSNAPKTASVAPKATTIPPKSPSNPKPRGGSSNGSLGGPKRDYLKN